MRIAVLGASGATGRLLVAEALARGLQVTALSRRPGPEHHPNLTAVAADVHDPASIRRAVEGSDVLLSGLGVTRGGSPAPRDPIGAAKEQGAPGTLTAGAEAVVAAGPGRILWLGAYGTGVSARAAGSVTRALLGLALRHELADKVRGDRTILEAGGTVFHAGPLTSAARSERRRTLPLAEAPRRLLPATVSRATVAAAMLDEAEDPRFPGQTVIPLSR